MQSFKQVNCLFLLMLRYDSHDNETLLYLRDYLRDFDLYKYVFMSLRVWKEA